MEQAARGMEHEAHQGRTASAQMRRTAAHGAQWARNGRTVGGSDVPAPPHGAVVKGIRKRMCRRGSWRKQRARERLRGQRGQRRAVLVVRARRRHLAAGILSVPTQNSARNS